VISINGKMGWLWRAVEADGFVLDALVQGREGRRAAEKLLRKLIRKQSRAPRVMVTDKLGSYGAARTGTGMNVEHRQQKGLNNRAENSHLPTRRRKRIMKRFTSAPPPKSRATRSPATGNKSTKMRPRSSSASSANRTCYGFTSRRLF
jgi:putative transposase